MENATRLETTEKIRAQKHVITVSQMSNFFSESLKRNVVLSLICVIQFLKFSMPSREFWVFTPFESKVFFQFSNRFLYYFFGLRNFLIILMKRKLGRCSVMKMRYCLRMILYTWDLRFLWGRSGKNARRDFRREKLFIMYAYDFRINETRLCGAKNRRMKLRNDFTQSNIHIWLLKKSCLINVIALTVLYYFLFLSIKSQCVLHISNTVFWWYSDIIS